MQFPLTAVALLTSLAASTMAQIQQSPPFNLQLCSANTTLDKQFLFGCHTGAAVESVCANATIPAPPESRSWTFGYNYTTQPDGSTIGNVTWTLTAIGDQVVSQIFNYVDMSPSNVNMILIEFPTVNVATVGFDDGGRMYVAKEQQRLDQWYMCRTNYLGYHYDTLGFLQGASTDTPTNPTCVKVDVKRVFL